MNATPPQEPLADDRSPAESDPRHIRAVFDGHRETALRWRYSTAKERIVRIKRLRDAMMTKRDALYDAFSCDLRKPAAEVEASELLPVMDEMRHAIGRIKSWMKPHKVHPTATMLGTSGWVQYQPRGRVLIMAPWNYPLNLCLGPLVSALAAGNTAIVKPSEMAPSVSALLTGIISETFPRSEVAVFEGGLPTAQALLDLPFDHIFFTGSPSVGKIVMTAAARHLTSVTLELGGKSPTIVGQTADIRLAAETLMWGKFLNDGQTCVAPDHVYVHDSVKQDFIAECLKVLRARYGETPNGRKQTPDLTHVVNRRHAHRIAALLADATERGARILIGGDVDITDNYVAPTLMDRVPADAKIMEEEIFGPLLPILDFSQLDQVIADINARPKPLALYLWSRDRQEIDQVMGQTTSGGACINHCMMQFAHGGLPFGGVNTSGIGNAHGHYGFRTFSHERAVLRSSPLMLVKMFYPPYTKSRSRIIRRVVDMLRLPML
ncbi:aldehyde dehydrogenase family protein [Telmatospirillum sp.]|uniref:aldehyde dehydrogenase family protein n=1 Tax=Telmatospirillum sp. TaxID=2079197 RepID=UPI0028452C72|nr:aldehyde dehydrogenase family protein [Telmatospirillum sp.]MDR3438753.1 aldehyde dehydrogenase family protein [Telmatospirillum sp.]